MAVQILVDSASDFDMEELKEKNIICVPLTITFGENHYKDCFELTKDKFYEKLLGKNGYPMIFLSIFRLRKKTETAWSQF